MKRIAIYLNALTVLMCISCASSNQQNPKNSPPQPHYTSSFPTRDVSANLARIQQSVQRIITTATYNIYHMADFRTTLSDIHKYDVTKLASKSSSTDKSKAGTAISILQNKQHTVLITAGHVLTFSDTLLVYRVGKNIPKRTYLESIGIKKRQHSYLVTSSGITKVDVLDIDPLRDLALIATDRTETNSDVPPLPIKIGKARDLQLASFLYILGYPLGSPMITRGIVSAPNYDRRSSFLTDALFNPGVSGGLIIASRDNYRHFEWIGMALEASGSEQQFLIPDPSKEAIYENYEAYTDTALISKHQLINYGLTLATPAEQILNFLYLHADMLKKLGLRVKYLLR